MTREEAIQAARARVEVEAHKPGRYRFGPLRWVVKVYQRSEVHTLEAPLVVGTVHVSERGGWGGIVTACVFDRGLRELDTWAWGEAKVKAADSRTSGAHLSSWAKPLRAARPGRRLRPATAHRKPHRNEMRSPMTKEEAVQAARAVVMRKACRSGERQWLVGAPPDSYGDPIYRVEMHVLEGSPVKGAVVVWGCQYWGMAIAFSATFKKLRKFIWRME